MNPKMSPEDEAFISMMMGAQPQAQVHRPVPQQQGAGQQQSKQQGGKKMKSAQAKEPWGAKALAPFEWVAKSASWLTNCNKNGGARFVFFIGSVACLGLSVETIYTAMPPSPEAVRQGIENRHFLPKPSINDDANIALLNPLPLAGAGLKLAANYTIGFLPFYPRHTINPRWTVWSDPGFYLALVISLSIQAIEAIALRRMGRRWEAKKKNFDRLNNRTLPELNPRAVIAARAARAELAAEGSGGYVGTGLVIVAVYTVEFVAFFLSVADSAVPVPFLTTVGYGIVNIFGFELCLAMAQDPEDD